jgi:hypothetical protein
MSALSLQQLLICRNSRHSLLLLFTYKNSSLWHLGLLLPSIRSLCYTRAGSTMKSASLDRPPPLHSQVSQTRSNFKTSTRIMPASHTSNSSMRVERGSAQSSSSSQNPPRASAKSSELERPIDRYLAQDRDYKSLVSASYDPYQEVAKRKRERQLREIIDGMKEWESN